MESVMESLYSAGWKSPQCRSGRSDFDPFAARPTGLPRLVLAFALIALVFGVVDFAARERAFGVSVALVALQNGAK
jgi:hypothetical protein